MQHMIYSLNINLKPVLAALVAVVTACSHSLSPSELKMYETKLRKYQNMTNINETTFEEIWSNSIKNCE